MDGNSILNNEIIEDVNTKEKFIVFKIAGMHTPEQLNCALQIRAELKKEIQLKNKKITVYLL